MSWSTRKKALVTLSAVVTLLGLGAVGFMIPKILGADDASASSGAAVVAPVVTTTTQAVPPPTVNTPRQTTPPVTNPSANPGYQQAPVEPSTKAPSSTPAPKESTAETFYGRLSLPMDPMWKVLNATDTSTYIGSTDPEKMCHSLEESCPSLRIFNYQASAADVANSYADCDAAPVPSGTKMVGGLTADYLVAKPCHEVSVQLLPDEHRIYVIPGKLVLVAVLVDGQTLDNLDAALAGAAWLA